MIQAKLLSDNELIRAYLEGSELAFAELSSRYYSRLFHSIYTFVQDKELAQDLLHEVLIKVVDNLRSGGYQHEGRFYCWANRIAHNVCVDHYRLSKRKQKEQTITYDTFLRYLVSSESNAETDITKSELHLRLRGLIDQLPAEQKEVVLLRHFVDLTFREIADITRVGVNTALGRMRYALTNIRKMIALENDFEW